MMKIKIGEFGRVLVRFTSSQIFSQFLRMLSGFLVMRFLDPEEYGLFSGVGVYLGYILLGHGGIINGLSRELPFELGKGNKEYAKELASSVFFLTKIISFIAALVFLVFALKHFLSNNYVYFVIFLSYTVVSGFHLFNMQYLPVLYRTSNDFDKLSKQNVYIGVGNLLSVILVWFWGLWGLCIRAVLLALWKFYLLFKNKPIKLDATYNLNAYRKLLKTGIPIFIVGYVNPLWSTIVNNIVFAFGGALNFGLYGLSNIIQGAFGVIPMSMNQVFYPRMAIMYGEGKTAKTIINTNIKALFYQFLLMFGLASVMAYLLPFIIPILLPKYTDGITAAQWMLFVPVTLSFSAINSIYNVVKKQKWYFVSLITGAVIGTLYIYLRIQFDGFQLEYFPQGLILGRTTQQILAIIF